MLTVTTKSEVGESLPPLTQHAVSVSLPTWDDCTGYEKGDARVLSRMKTGYPRFFIHKSIQELGNAILDQYGSKDSSIILLPSRKIIDTLVEFLLAGSNQDLRSEQIRPIALVLRDLTNEHSMKADVDSHTIFGCFMPKQYCSIAKEFWQHTGTGISSRRAEYYKILLDSKHPKSQNETLSVKGMYKAPQRYRPKIAGSEPVAETVSLKDVGTFLEERFGRNLNSNLASEAKLAIRRRIATALSPQQSEDRLGKGKSDCMSARQVSEDDVYLYPTGMQAIFSSHQYLLKAFGKHRSVCYGFPYIDTLKILEKFGPGCIFYGHGSDEELLELESRLSNGERVLGFFCEFPGNPLLKSPDLARINALAIRFNFAVVVDETIGNFVNVDVLKYADIVVSSLTKVFSGDSNVMGGSIILNQAGRFYEELNQVMKQEYEDVYWSEDAIFMERNSRDFLARSERINRNAEAVASLLYSHPKVKRVYYPKYSETRHLYDQCRKHNGGYGGLLSVTFHNPDEAVKFYDYINTYKGPSLGTNFTLCSPYVILAHWNELPWAASYGVEENLVRFSIGLEDISKLVATFKSALEMLTG